MQTAPRSATQKPINCRAPLAQLDRATDYESVGREFESLRARSFSSFCPFKDSVERLSVGGIKGLRYFLSAVRKYFFQQFALFCRILHLINALFRLLRIPFPNFFFEVLDVFRAIRT